MPETWDLRGLGCCVGKSVLGPLERGDRGIQRLSFPLRTVPPSLSSGASPTAASPTSFYSSVMRVIQEWTATETWSWAMGRSTGGPPGEATELGREAPRALTGVSP